MSGVQARGICPACQRMIAGGRVGPESAQLRTHGSPACAGSGRTVPRLSEDEIIEREQARP